VDEARAVIQRLNRIEALDREGAHAATLLAELRELVREAEAWARLEADERAEDAVERCRQAIASGIVSV
jgi:transposase